MEDKIGIQKGLLNLKVSPKLTSSGSAFQSLYLGGMRNKLERKRENNNCRGSMNTVKRSWCGQQMNTGRQCSVLAKPQISLCSKVVRKLEGTREK